MLLMADISTLLFLIDIKLQVAVTLQYQDTPGTFLGNFASQDCAEQNNLIMLLAHDCHQEQRQLTSYLYSFS